MTQYTRILNLGDSITFGARSQYGQTYPVILENLLADCWVPSICINAGVNGERSYEIVERGWGYLGSDDWIKICVAMMGTNDSKPGSRTPHELYMGHWERLHRMCSLTGTDLVVCEIPRINPTGQPEYDEKSMDWMATANGLLELWAASEGLPFVKGLRERMTDNHLADGIHPNNNGNALIAGCVYATLRGGQSHATAPTVSEAAAGTAEFATGGVVPNGRPVVLDDQDFPLATS